MLSRLQNFRRLQSQVNSERKSFHTSIVTNSPEHAVVARVTKDATRITGPATMLIPGLPIMLMNSGFGFAIVAPLNKIMGTPSNSSSHAFGYSAGSMENAPSRWDIDEASQNQLLGTDLQKHLIEEYQRRGGKPLDHNEVLVLGNNLQDAKRFVTNPLQVKSNEFAYFRDMVCAEHGINPRTLFYSQSDGKLFDISKAGHIKECSKDGEKGWEHLKIAKFNPQEYSMAEKIRKEQERFEERQESAKRWR